MAASAGKRSKAAASASGSAEPPAKQAATAVGLALDWPRLEAVGIVGFADCQNRLDVVHGARTLNPTEELHASDVKEFPSLRLKGVAFEPEQLYTFALVDPDAPSPADPKFASWLHYLAYNCRGGDPAAGKELAAFVPSAPGDGSGFHRYFWLIYRQDGAIADTRFNDKEHIPLNSGFEPRRKFSPEAWRQTLATKLHPLAMASYQCAFDEHCNAVHAQVKATAGAS